MQIGNTHCLPVSADEATAIIKAVRVDQTRSVTQTTRRAQNEGARIPLTTNATLSCVRYSNGARWAYNWFLTSEDKHGEAIYNALTLTFR